MQVLIGGKEVLHESLYIRKPSWNLRGEEKRKKKLSKRQGTTGIMGKVKSMKEIQS